MAIETATVAMSETGAGAPPKADPTAVAAAGNKGNAPPGAPAARPEGLPEGFNSVAELAAKYAELQGSAKGEPAKEGTEGKKEGDGALPPPAAKEGDNKEPPKDDKKPAEGKKEGAEPASEDAPFDVNVYYKEYAETGAVSDASVEAISKKLGVDPALVRDHVKYQAAYADQQMGELRQLAGGEEAFNAKVAWGAQSWSDYGDFYNAVTSGDYKTAKYAMAALNTAYTAREGKEPMLVKGGTGAGNSGAAPFKSRDEQTQAMKDPRYRTDAAYRESVRRRSAGLKGRSKAEPKARKRTRSK